MLSRTSCFNKTLFRKNLTRFWPLWGMASFGGSLFPLAMLLNLIQRGYYDEDFTALEWASTYYEALTYAVPIVSLFYAILCAMVVWSYLYNHRSVSLMHTLPIRRSGLFVTNFLSGMAMMIIPYVFIGGLCVLISLLYGVFDLVPLLVTVAGVLLESFFYFSTATLAAFITGNVFALPALYFLLHFLAVMLDWLVSTFARGFILGLQGDYTGAVEFLSPTVYIMSNVRAERTYEEIPRVFENGREYYDQILVAVDMVNFHVIVIYALVGAVCLGVAWALYHRRRSESAGDVVSVGWVKPFFRYGIAGLAALLGGLFLYELFWNSFNYSNSRYYEVIPMLVCMFVAGTIGYFAASMLLAKSLRVFKSAWRGLVLVLAGCAVVCCVLHFDVFGVTTYVPAIEDVEQVDLRAADNRYTFYPGQEDELLEQVRDLHAAIAADADYIRDLEDAWNGAMPAGGQREDTLTSTYVRFYYYMKDGRTIRRNYTVPMTRSRLTEAGTYDQKLDTLINGEAMKLKRLYATDETRTLSGGNLYVDKRNQGFELSTREAQAIMQGIRQDAAEGTWGNYDWFYQSEAGDYALDLNLSFQYPSSNDPNNMNYDSIYIRIKPAMRHTVDALLELDLVKESELVTYLELYPERYDYELVKDYEEATSVAVVYAG